MLRLKLHTYFMSTCLCVSERGIPIKRFIECTAVVVPIFNHGLPRQVDKHDSVVNVLANTLFVLLKACYWIEKDHSVCGSKFVCS